MSKKGKRYSNDFKKKAVAYSRQSGRSIAETARYFDVSDQSLRNWIHDSNGIKRASRLRVRQLEKELKETKRRLSEMERTNQMLAKATVIFAESKQRDSSSRK